MTDALIGRPVGEPATVRLVFPDPYDGAAGVFRAECGNQRNLVTAIDFSQYVETNKNALWEIAVDTSTVLQYPEAELREYEEDFRECYLAFAREYGMELDDYLRQFFGTNEDGAGRVVPGKCAGLRQAGPGDVSRILRAENLEITQEDLEACKPDWLITYGYEREAPKGREDPGVQESLRAMAALRKAQEFVYEHAEPQTRTERKRRLLQAALSGRLDEARRFPGTARAAVQVPLAHVENHGEISRCSRQESRIRPVVGAAVGAVYVVSSGETHGPPPGSGTGAHRPDRDTRPWRYGDRSRGAASPEVQGEPGQERLPVLKDMAVLLKGVPPLCWNQAGGARSSPVSHGS